MKEQAVAQDSLARRAGFLGHALAGLVTYRTNDLEPQQIGFGKREPRQ